MSVNKVQLKRLAEPFNQNEIFWRPLTTEKAKGMAQVTPYAKARAYRARLSGVLGVENWRMEYETGPAGGVICHLEILIERSDIVLDSHAEWVWKEDGATNPSMEKLFWSADPEEVSVKGGLSNAFKRAAQAWGIGTYLQYAPKLWVLWDFVNKCALQPPMLPTRGQMKALHAKGKDLYGDAWETERALACYHITQGQEASAHGLIERQVVYLDRVLTLRLVLRQYYGEEQGPEEPAWKEKELALVSSVTGGATNEMFLLSVEQVQHLLSNLVQHFEQIGAAEKPALEETL